MQIAPRDAPSALIHLYRGELGRMTAYRVRLDTTTNWAVGTTAAITTFAIGMQELPHYVFGLPVLLNFIFLWIEARRFVAYELIRRRVRLLEGGFYAAVLDEEPLPNWEKQLYATLREPRPPISRWRAVAVRLRRNYLWLLSVVYLGWLVKLDLQGDVPEDAHVGELPGSFVLALVGVVIVGLGALAIRHRHLEEG